MLRPGGLLLLRASRDLQVNVGLVSRGTEPRQPHTVEVHTVVRDAVAAPLSAPTTITTANAATGKVRLRPIVVRLGVSGGVSWSTVSARAELNAAENHRVGKVGSKTLLSACDTPARQSG